MDKLKMETPDVTAENIEKIGALFPSAVTEMRGEDGSIKKGINFEILKQLLSPDVVEEGDERYEFTWVGKKQAIAEAARPTTKTLRPVKADSRNWDTTENLYIEGDNLEVLKILQESYLGKVKMIYIDPPYNTGHDFIYRDDFGVSPKEWSEKSGEWSEDGDRLFENTESNGRFHSDWCSMMYSRLMLARNLLSEDGAAFIHIDENEVYTLSMICKEVFGESNELGTIIWDKRNPKGVVAGVAYQHESILVYCKNIVAFSKIPFLKEKEHAEEMVRKVQSLIATFKGINDNVRKGYKNWLKENKALLTGGESAYSFIDDNGKIYQPVSMAAPDKPETRSHRPLIHPITGKPCPVPQKGWRFTDQKMDELLKNNKIEFGTDETTQPRQKYYLEDNMQEAVSSLIYFGGSDNAMGLPFDNPKPVYIAKRLINSLCKQGDEVILDFFSGSATTAHAVMQLNAEDGGHRKFIMVQLPEPCDEKSEAFKAGYKNICEIGKERIRRAGDKIKAEHPDADLDTGFRVFRVDESNMKNVYYHPEEVTQLMLGETVSNIKEDRTDMDLLYACLLDWGVEINLPHTSTQVAGCTVHNVDNGALAACFDKAVPRAVVEYMANLQPLRAVFRDEAFATDAEKINVTEIFKNLSPDTKVKVI
jgi:adenine-specific DNA-methyltransferase